MKITSLLIISAIVITFSMCESDMDFNNKSATDISIFLVDQNDSVSTDADLRDVTVESEPWISSADIEMYDISSHLLYLNYDKPINWDFIEQFENRRFVVYAGNSPIYSGEFLPIYSSRISSSYFILMPHFYPDDIIPISMFMNDSSSNIDARNDPRIIEALLQTRKLSAGIDCELSAVVLDTTSATFRFTITNNDLENLMILDVEKMGLALFNYYTTGLLIENEDSAYIANERDVETPENWDSWELSWFTLLRSGEQKSYTIATTGYDSLPNGIYNCSFTFPSVNYIEKSERFVVEDGVNARIWLGRVKSNGYVVHKLR